MPDIRTQKLLYHLTSLSNLSSILEGGLKSRSQLDEFVDVADQEIISRRQALSLEKYVPFHWFSRNPFEGRVQKNHPKRKFVLIAVKRTLAEEKNWKVIPRHPLADEDIQLLNYEDGFAAIDWELMNVRDYSDPACKSVCMAECLSPRKVSPAKFSTVFVPTDEIAENVARKIRKQELSIDVTVNAHMFVR